MLALVDIPKSLENLHRDNKILGKEICDALAGNGEQKLLKGGTVISEWENPVYIFIHKGYFKFFLDEKLIRFYTDNDFISPMTGNHFKNCRIVNELSSDIDLFERESFLLALSGDLNLQKKWTLYLENENYIISSLSSLYMGKDIKPDIIIRQFLKDEIIIKEGDSASEVYELIEGKAVVTLKGVEVGSIERGEIFGEISLLTEEIRSATVKAKNNCVVRIINEEDFNQIVKYRPQTVFSMAKTLGKRLVELNNRIIGT